MYIYMHHRNYLSSNYILNNNLKGLESSNEPYVTTTKRNLRFSMEAIPSFILI